MIPSPGLGSAAAVAQKDANGKSHEQLLRLDRVLEKLEFTFVRRYRTTPGVIACAQEVNRYELRRPNRPLQQTAPLRHVFDCRS
jgi:hypothetical protein